MTCTVQNTAGHYVYVLYSTIHVLGQVVSAFEGISNSNLIFMIFHAVSTVLASLVMQESVITRSPPSQSRQTGFACFAGFLTNAWASFVCSLSKEAPPSQVKRSGHLQSPPTEKNTNLVKWSTHISNEKAYFRFLFSCWYIHTQTVAFTVFGHTWCMVP